MMKKLKEKTGTKIQVVQDEAESQSYIVFKGTKTQNEKAQLELQKLFNDSYYCKHKPKKRIRKEYLDAIEQVCKDKFKVVIRASPNEIEIKGQRCKETEEWLDKKLPELDELRFPTEWKSEPVYQFLNGDNLKCYKLNPHEKDSAWHKIEENFTKTIPDGKIRNIELIQDIELWKQYQKEYEKISQSLGKQPKKTMLWYSTARTDPEEIILSKERNGLIARDDIEEKMYGTAIYFSKNASFCASDTFISEKGERKMFYADVLLGDQVFLEQQQVGKMPKKAGTNIQYDSVQGKLGDSEVHMIYKSERCYPTYLVSFVL